MKVPAQAADDPGSLTDEILAMIDKKPNLAFRVVEPSNRQIWFPKPAARATASASIGSDLP